MALRGIPTSRTAPDVNRILYAKNLPYNITGEELYEVFGRYGAIRQLRRGVGPTTRGTAFIVYEDLVDAKTACERLNGFHLQDRYLVILYHQVSKQHAKEQAKQDIEKREADLAALKKVHNIEEE